MEIRQKVPLKSSLLFIWINDEMAITNRRLSIFNIYTFYSSSHFIFTFSFKPKFKFCLPSFQIHAKQIEINLVETQTSSNLQAKYRLSYQIYKSRLHTKCSFIEKLFCLHSLMSMKIRKIEIALLCF
jgi:hypothetical protein